MLLCAKFEKKFAPQKGPKLGVISPKNGKCWENRIVVVGMGRMVV
jgi:hypothetical protein